MKRGNYATVRIVFLTFFIVALFVSQTDIAQATTDKKKRTLETILYQLKFARFFRNVSINQDLSIDGALESNGRSSFAKAATFNGNANFNAKLNTVGITLTPQDISRLDTANLADGSLYYDDTASALKVWRDPNWQTVVWSDDPGTASNQVALTTDTTGNYVASIASGAGITGGDSGSEGAALTLALDQDAALNWTNGHTWTLAGSETNQTNLTLSGTTNSQGSGVTIINGTASGNQYGVYLDNAASSGTTEASLVIDNSDTDTAVTSAIQVVNAGGGFTNLIDNAGTGISGAELNLLDGGVALSELTDSGTLTVGTVDVNGGAIDGTTIGVSAASSGAFTTLTSTGVTTLGNDSTTVAVNSNDWDITTLGVITGASFDANGTGNAISNIDNADLTNNTLDFDKLADSLTLDAATTATRTITGDENTLTLSLVNNGGTAGFDQLVVIANTLSANTSGDLNTETLLLLDQADTTTAGTTIVDDALLITNSGGSTLTDAIQIGSGSQAITNAINIASTGVTTDIVLQNGETIDNNADGTLLLTATTTTLSGGLKIGSGTTILKHLSGTATNLVTSAISTITCGSYGTITVTGAAVGDTVVATPDASSSTTGIEDNNLSWSAYVSSTNTVTITACNPTLGSINAADDQEWRADVWQH